MSFCRAPALCLALVAWLPAPGAASRVPVPIEVCVEAPGGHLLHALTYRSAMNTAVPVILHTKWTKADTLRWTVAARELCAGGFDVLIPIVPPDGQAEPGDFNGARALADFAISAWIDSLPLSIALERPVSSVHLICFGEAGWEIPPLARRELPLRSVAWIAPQGDFARLATWDYPSEDPPRLLLVATPGDRTSSALAGDLFSRFNRIAQFWLMSAGEDAYLAASRLHEYLRNWLDIHAGGE